MFNRFRNKTRVGTGLLKSELFDEAGFYRAFVKDVKAANHYVVTESPFLTEKRALFLAKYFARLAKRGVKVRVNTRNPRHHEKLLEIQSWKAIRVLRDHGVKVYFFNDMRHRKLDIIDEQILWEGSLNIISQGYSREIMRRTDSPQLATQMAAFTKINNWFW